jgi:hypothetical protein
MMLAVEPALGRLKARNMRIGFKAIMENLVPVFNQASDLLDETARHKNS